MAAPKQCRKQLAELGGQPGPEAVALWPIPNSHDIRTGLVGRPYHQGPPRYPAPALARTLQAIPGRLSQGCGHVFSGVDNWIMAVGYLLDYPGKRGSSCKTSNGSSARATSTTDSESVQMSFPSFCEGAYHKLHLGAEPIQALLRAEGGRGVEEEAGKKQEGHLNMSLRCLSALLTYLMLAQPTY